MCAFTMVHCSMMTSLMRVLGKGTKSSSQAWQMPFVKAILALHPDHLVEVAEAEAKERSWY